MTTPHFLLCLCLIAVITGFGAPGLAANTDGSVTFKVTTTANTGQYNPNNVAAVWVVDSSNRFVKTLCRHGVTRVGYLTQWIAARGSYTTVDGTTSATLTSEPQTHTVTWNCRNTNGVVVPDGQYTFKAEYTSDNLQGPYLTNGASFMKSLSAVTTNYANFSNGGGAFTNMSLTYTPLLPDIAITALSPTNGAVDTLIAVIASMTNRTASATPAFTVTLSNMTTSTQISTQRVSTLAGNASTNLSFAWNTAGLPAGTYTLNAQAEILPGETNTADNTRNSGVNLVASVYDIAVQSIAIGTVVPPRTVTNVVVVVSNAGTYAESFGVGLRDLTSAQSIGSTSLTSLASGGKATLTFGWNTTNASIGYHTLEASSSTLAGETQTANNTNTLTLIVANGLETNSLIARGSAWKYLDSGLDISEAPWIQPRSGYYDGFWPSGQAPIGYGTTGIVTSVGTAPASGPDPILAADSAADAAYNLGWANGSSGGTGFGPWQLSAGTSGGHFIGSSTNNAGGSGGIDTAGRSWGLWASTGTSEAWRTFTGGALTTGRVLRLAFDNGWIATGRSAGVGLRNASGSTLWEFYFAGGSSSYSLNDQGGIRDTALPFTGNGVQIAFYLTTSTSYVAEVTAGASTGSYTGSLMAQADSSIAQVRAWNYESGSGQNCDMFLNSFSISNAAAPAALSNNITTYFRREFTMDFGPISVTGLVRKADGVVLYLNGHEIDRQNMAAGAVMSASSLATTGAMGAALTDYTPFTIAPSNLVVGRNWMAAELHLAATSSPVKVFDLELSALNSVAPRTNSIVPLSLQPDGNIQSGDQLAVTITLTNSGNAASAATVVIRDVATGAILAAQAVPALVPGETTVLRLAWPTMGAATGTRTLQAMTVVNGVTNLVATSSNSVTIAALDFAPRLVNDAGSIGGRCNAVAASGQTAYLGCGSTLQVWDTGAPASPVQLGSVRLPGIIESILVQNSYAYVAAGASGVHIIDVSHPVTPAHVASFDTSGNAHHLTVAGTRLVVADGLGGIRVLDISSPASPALAGAYQTAGSARAARFLGPNLYVLDMDEGLQVLTTNPTPAVVGALRRITGGLALASLPNAVAIGDGNGGLHRVATTNVTAPVLESSRLLAAAGRALAASSSALYIAAGPAGLLTADPATLSVTATNATNGEASDVVLSGSLLYVATGFGGCQIWDISSPLAPSYLGTMASGNRPVDAVISGDNMFVAADESGFQVHSLTNHARPAWLATASTSTNPRCLEISGGFAYVAEALGGLKIYNVTNPASPVLVGTDPSTGLATIRRMALSGSRLAMTDGHQINLLNVANPALPVLLATNVPAGYVFDLAADDTHIFAACGGSGLKILDNATLATAGTFSTAPEPVVAISVNGIYAYAGNGLSTVRTLVISNAAAPTAIQTTTGPGFSIASSGYLTTIIDGHNQGRVLNMTDPLTPVTRMSLPHLSLGLRVRGKGALILTAEDEAGLALFNANPGDVNLNGIPDTVDQQIVDANAGDLLRTIWDVNGSDDFDHDGLSNLAEYLAGTSPTNSASLFAASAAMPLGGTGKFVVRWYSVPGKTYTIHKSTDLKAGFTPLQSGIVDTAPVNSYTDTVSTADAFYMISVP